MQTHELLRAAAYFTRNTNPPVKLVIEPEGVAAVCTAEKGGVTLEITRRVSWDLLKTADPNLRSNPLCSAAVTAQRHVKSKMESIQ